MDNNKDFLLEKEVKTAFKPAVIFASGYIFQNFLYLVCTILLAKILGVTSFGLYSLGWAIVGIGSMLSGLGFSYIPSKFIPVYRHENNDGKLKSFISFLFKTQLIAVILVTSLLMLSSRFISIKIYKEPSLAIFLILLSGLIPFQKFLELFGSIFKGFKKVSYSVYIQRFFEPAYRTLFIMAVFLMGGYMKGVFAGLYSGVIFALILAILMFRTRIISSLGQSEATPCNKKEIILYSLPLLGVSLISYFMGKTDILMIGYFLNPDKIGIYNIAFKLSLVVSLSLTALNSIFAPIISSLHAKKNHNKLGAAYRSFTRTILYISIFIFSSLLLLAEPLLSLIGKNFTAGVYPLAILAIGQLINVSVGSAATILSMTKYPRINMYNSAALLCINIFLNLFLIPRYGILGAAIATSSSVLLINILRLIEVYVLLGIHPFSLGYVKPFLAWGVALAVAKLLLPMLGISYNLAVFSTFVIVFAGMSLALGISSEERYMISLLKNYRRGPEK
ncbi:MAG: flippase [Candidatus Tantalella remota]|nr:flippase [Candidatus Tantalella remota]